jgi:hypothetical protein
MGGAHPGGEVGVIENPFPDAVRDGVGKGVRGITLFQMALGKPAPCAPEALSQCLVQHMNN